jgi:UDP:flavonoid glycosyltransferase YjiC (YdhE family)
MATFLFIVSEHVGHLHATLRMARGLVRRGHIVSYTGRDQASGIARAQRLTFESTPEFEALPRSRPAWAPRQRRAAAAAWRERARDLRATADRIVERVRPDVLVFDPFMLLYYLPFRRHGIRAAVLSANPLLDPDRRAPPYTGSAVPTGSMWSDIRISAAWLARRAAHAGETVRDAVERVATGTSDEWMTRVLAAETDFPLAAERVNRQVRWDLCLRSVHELVLWPPSFDWPRARPLRERVHYVGASVDLNRAEPRLDPALIPRCPRLVYCSLGTVATGDRGQAEAFLQHVIDAFAGMRECALIVACGRATAPERFRRTPNVTVVAAAPQLQLLAAAHLHITHGGANSVKESVLSGVPMLVYPRRADQPGNAARVAFHGLGERGDRAADGPGQIAERAARVLEGQGYHHSAKRWQEEFLAYERRELDVAALESLAAASGGRIAAASASPP